MLLGAKPRSSARLDPSDSTLAPPREAGTGAAGAEESAEIFAPLPPSRRNAIPDGPDEEPWNEVEMGDARPENPPDRFSPTAGAADDAKDDAPAASEPAALARA